MNRYTDPRTSNPSKPERPTFCGVDGCTTRYLGMGKGYARGLADILIALPDGSRIARCWEHYNRDLDATGKSVRAQMLADPDSIPSLVAKRDAEAFGASEERGLPWDD